MTSDVDYKSLDDFLLLNIRNENGCYYAGSLPVSLEQAKDFDPEQNPSRDPGMTTTCSLKYSIDRVKLITKFQIKDYQSNINLEGYGLVTQKFSKSNTKNKRIWEKSCTVLVTPQNVDLELVNSSSWHFKEESSADVPPFGSSRILRFVEKNNQGKTLTLYCPLHSKNKDIRTIFKPNSIDVDCHPSSKKNDSRRTTDFGKKIDSLRAK